MDCPLYDEYATVRRGITLLPDEVHKIQALRDPMVTMNANGKNGKKKKNAHANAVNRCLLQKS